MNGREVRDVEMRDREARDGEIRDREARDGEIRGREVRDREIRSREARDGEIRDREARHREISGGRQYRFMENFAYSREAGTKGEEQAAKRICRELEEMGLHPKIEPFSFETFRVAEESLKALEPYEKEYPVRAYLNTSNTKPEGLTGEFLYGENGDEISLYLAENKILLLNGTVRRDMYEKLKKAGALGFLTLWGGPLDEGEDKAPQPQTLRGVRNPQLPGACIHYNDARELVEKGAKRLKLAIIQEKQEQISHNVRVSIPGTDKSQEILTLTAHYDSVPQGPGAYDNMAGCAIIMELCRYFANHRPRRTMEFIWFGAEEKGLLGSLAYTEQHREELKFHKFNMNVDLAGQLIGGNVIGVTGDKKICGMILDMVREENIGVSFKNQIWGSDSNTFAWKGIPAMTLNRDGFGMHTRHDTLEMISPWSLERSARLLCCLADKLGNIEEIPFPRDIPQEMRDELEKYFEDMVC